MSNKALGWGIIVSFGLAFLNGLFGLEYTAGGMALVGLAMAVFSIWGAVRLIKS